MKNVSCFFYKCIMDILCTKYTRTTRTKQSRSIIRLLKSATTALKVHFTLIKERRDVTQENKSTLSLRYLNPTVVK